jgi:uncharacterized membrane protein
MSKTLRTQLKKICATITSLFLNGLFTILPLTLTIAIFSFSLRLLKDWLAPIARHLPTCLLQIPHSEIILGILFILLVGTILKFFILRSLIHWFESLIFKLPLIRPVYSGIKQLVHAFSPQDTMSFKKVVLIEFPRKGVYSIGFVTSEVPQQLSPSTTQGFICVFVPTTPNPTTGFFMFVPTTDITVIDLTRQEAMALIISGGIIQPERFAEKE